MVDYFTPWYTAILTNGIAYAIASVAGGLYNKFRYLKKYDLNDEETEHHMKWYDFIVFFLIILVTMYFVYFVMFWVFGYIPMSKIAPSIWDSSRSNINIFDT